MIWGFHREQFKHTQTELDEKTINIFKWTLPISFTNMTIKEVEIHKNHILKEAKDLALDMARKISRNIYRVMLKLRMRKFA